MFSYLVAKENRFFRINFRSRLAVSGAVSFLLVSLFILKLDNKAQFNDQRC